MAKTITPINRTTDVVDTIISQVNAVIDVIASEALTANTNANGAFVTGNSQLFGIYTANVVAVYDELRGGNVQSSASLTIGSNLTQNNSFKISLGNTTVNTVANSTVFKIANNSHSLALNKIDLRVGTSSVNSIVNSTSFSLANSTINMELTKDRLKIGDAGVNAVVNSSVLTLANSTVSFSLIKPSSTAVLDGNYYLASDGSWKALDISSKPNFKSATELLQGEEGIACHFLTRGYVIADYAGVYDAAGRPENLFVTTRSGSGTGNTGSYIDRDRLLKFADANVPRYDYDPATGESLGLLLEEQRTNVLLHTEEFQQSQWVKYSSSVSQNAQTAPDGTITADRISALSGVADHYVRQDLTLTGSQQTFSVFLKYNNFSPIRLAAWDGTRAYELAVNLPAGTYNSDNGNIDRWYIKDFGNGWFRCSMVFTPTSTTGYVGIRVLSGSASGGESVNVWGAQLELGESESSYMNCGGTTTTRNSDQMVLNSAAAFPIQTDGFSMYWKFNMRRAVSGCTPEFGVWSSSATTNSGLMRVTPSGQITAGYYSGGSTKANFGLGTATDRTTIAAAARFRVDDVAGRSSLGSSASDTNASPAPSTLNDMYLRNWCSGHLKEIIYITRPWTDEELSFMVDI